MKIVKNPLIIIVITFISFMLLGFSLINTFQQRPSFAYKKVPGVYLKNLATSVATYQSQAVAKMKSAYDLTKSLPVNYVTNGSVDYTSELQNGINTHNNIVFPDFPVLVNPAGLLFKSNTAIIFRSHSKILLQANALKSYAIMKIYDLRNVKIFSPVVVGDREKHQGTDGEAGIGIKMYGSVNIQIYHPQVSNCWGDGIYIGNSVKNVTNGVVIDCAQLDYNRRNGLSITGGKNITITHALVSNTFGTPPMEGIDVEPNNNKTIIDSISVSNYISYNNSNAALQFSLTKLPGPTLRSLNIKADNVTSINSNVGVVIGGLIVNPLTKKMVGNIELNNINIINATLPIKVEGDYDQAPTVHLRQLRFTKSNPDGSETKQDKEMKTLKSRVSLRTNIFVE